MIYSTSSPQEVFSGLFEKLNLFLILLGLFLTPFVYATETIRPDPTALILDDFSPGHPLNHLCPLHFHVNPLSNKGHLYEDLWMYALSSIIGSGEVEACRAEDRPGREFVRFFDFMFSFDTTLSAGEICRQNSAAHAIASEASWKEHQRRYSAAMLLAEEAGLKPDPDSGYEQAFGVWKGRFYGFAAQYIVDHYETLEPGTDYSCEISRLVSSGPQ